MSPIMRVLRTIMQVVLAEAAAIPGAVAALGVDASTAAQVGGVCGAVVVVVSAAWNVIEHASGKTVGAVPTPNGTTLPPAGPGPTPPRPAGQS